MQCSVFVSFFAIIGFVSAFDGFANDDISRAMADYQAETAFEDMGRELDANKTTTELPEAAKKSLDVGMATSTMAAQSTTDFLGLTGDEEKKMMDSLNPALADAAIGQLSSGSSSPATDVSTTSASTTTESSSTVSSSSTSVDATSLVASSTMATSVFGDTTVMDNSTSSTTTSSVFSTEPSTSTFNYRTADRSTSEVPTTSDSTTSDSTTTVSTSTMTAVADPKSSGSNATPLSSLIGVGSLVYRLKGSDPDPDVLKFGVREKIGSQLLDIRPASLTEADVYLKSHLQANEYNLTIFVTDGQMSTEVISQIFVTDPDVMPSSPFVALHPLFSVFEGSDKFAIRYIFGPRGSSTAEILLVKELDFESKNLYSLNVLALNAWTNETVDTRNVAIVEVVVAVKDVKEESSKPAIKLSQANAVNLFADMAHKTQLVLWILLALVILTMVFLICLISCWCCCRFREKRNKLVPLEENGKVIAENAAVTGSDTKPMIISSNQNNFYEKTSARPMSAPNDALDQVDGVVDRAQGGKYFRSRHGTPSFSGRAVSENRGYISDKDVRTYEGRARNLRHVESSTGTYILVDDVDRQHYRMFGRVRGKKSKPRVKQTEILYIRSPPPANSSEYYGRSVSETAIQLDEEDDIDSIESANTRLEDKKREKGSRQVSFKVNSDQVSMSTDQEPIYSIPQKRNRSVSTVTLSSKAGNGANHHSQSQSKLKSPPPLPGSVEYDEEEEEEVGRSDTQPKSIYNDNQPERNSNVQTPNTEMPELASTGDQLEPSGTQKPDAIEPKSDSDSGIGNTRHKVSELNLKNKNLMEKKSIFTIAYDGVKTTRLKSADSVQGTP
ncbi:hypothetical protein HDE_07304 [Halotydeus destructor]|nr:hypothetical protein HDE_07304 [Halotydeus destructor]